MTVTLYHFPASAPSRAVLLLSRTLGIDVDVKILNLFTKEQLNPNFIQINPQHTVPTLVHDDFVLSESKAIAAYLVKVFGKDDTLYPKDPRKKAIVDQRLYFDIGTLYSRIKSIFFPVLYLDEIEIPEELKSSVDEALGFLDIFLEDNEFVAGNDMTIADFSIVTSVSNLQGVGWDMKPYGNVHNWLTKCSRIMPGYEEINKVGVDQYSKAVLSKLAPGQL